MPVKSQTIKTDSGIPAATCTPALTGAYAGALGASAYTTISGQTYSATGNGTYTASNDFASPFTASSGIVGNEFVGTAFDGTKTYALLEPAGAAGIAATLAGTTWTIQAQTPFTNTTGSTTVGSGAVTDVVFLGVDKSTGEGLCYINGVKVTGGTWDAGTATIFSSISSFAYYARDQVLSGGTASGSVVTNIADMTHTYGLTRDWCGTPA